MEENSLSQEIIEAAKEVHKWHGGPGLLESVYEKSLVNELRRNDLEVERQKKVPLKYKGQKLDEELRLDIFVEQKVIVECKAVSEYNPIFETQVLTYLRSLDLKLGLVLNFGQSVLKDGIHRVVNDL